MSKVIRVKRGLNARRLEVVPALGEMVWTTDLKEMYVGDGVTIGGIKLTGSIENLFVLNTEKAQASGVATLDATGKIPTNQIPAIAISEVWVVNSEAEQLALPAEVGDVAVRVDLNQSFIHNGSSTGNMSDWTLLRTPTDSVISVNGQQNVVVLGLGDLDRVDLTGGVIPGDLIQWNGSDWVPVAAGEVGRTQFITLTDTPNTFVGQDGKFTIVDEVNQTIVFTDVIDGGSYSGNTQELSNPFASGGPVIKGPIAPSSAPVRPQATLRKAPTRAKRPNIKRL